MTPEQEEELQAALRKLDEDYDAKDALCLSTGEPAKYRYEAIIDYMLSNPQMKKGEIAQALGYTQAWFSQLIRSDAFRARYETRRAELQGDLMNSVIRKQFEIASEGADRVMDELRKEDCDARFALDATQSAMRNLGFGAPRGVNGGNNVLSITQNNVNVAGPQDRPILEAARARLEAVSRMSEQHALPAPKAEEI